ncbi:transcription elongation factor spt4 [Komagataella kurtzmanii]|nr:transcription elongation factor spt4 [Komagataella kurtzmanii]
MSTNKGVRERACMLCGIVLPGRVFMQNGCPNCDSVLNLRDSDQATVNECTSSSFEGLVAVGDNEHSWVAKWLRVDRFQPGLYAVRVDGRLPSDIVAALEQYGVYYRPRDGSVIE